MSYKTYEVRVHDNKTITWSLNGKLHREDGPAIIWSNGNQHYYINGKLHREDGPAIIETDGSQYYCLDNISYTKKQYDAEIKRRKKEKKEVVELTVADVEKLVGKKVKIVK